MIEVTDLLKRYGSFTAVDHLTFTVRKGSICGFLGPNGAGKSTTMNMLTGYIHPTGGRIVIDGHDMTDEPIPAKRLFGYLPEVPPVYPDMTCREYLAFAGRLKKIPVRKLKPEIDRVIATAALTEMQNRLIRTLSKGYRQRVGLASALLGDPEVIILDEPASGFDPKQMIELRELIRSLGGKHTVILSSHILSEISAVCDSVLLINHGRLAASGSIDSLARYKEGTNVYECTILGNPETVRSALSGLPVSSLTVRSAPGDACTLIFESAGETDPRPDLFYRLAEARCPILELHSHAMDLEDIFLSLTEGVPS